MLALVTSHASPDHVALQEAPPPIPAPDEALIDVRAFGINRGELRLLEARPDGWRPGQDIAGVVLRAAADGSGPKEGVRVVAMIDQAGWAELAAPPTTRIAALPDSVGFEAAATLPVAGLTALRALRLGGLLLGKRVLITGASGGVGHFGVQLAAAAGAWVTAVARGQYAKELQAMGAAQVISTVEEMSGVYDLILESVGGAWLTAAAKAVAADGVVAFYGNSSREPSTINFADFGGHPRAQLRPFHVYQSGGPDFGVDLGLMASLIDAGKLKPQIGFQESWRRLGAALTALRDRRVVGKAILQRD